MFDYEICEMFYADSSIRSGQEYFRRSLRHRMYGPASQFRYTDSSLEQEWFIDGWRHRAGAPSYQRWYGNGKLSCREWYLHDLLHRADGPAKQVWHKNGTLYYEVWWVHGKRHRVGGPAIRFWDVNGAISTEEWLSHGEYHRIDGPAYILWQKYTICRQVFYLYGTEITDEIHEWATSMGISDLFQMSHKETVIFKMVWR